MTAPARRHPLVTQLLVLLLCVLPALESAADGAAGDGAPGPGLMWNRTGLPAVFPLLVKTPPGQDHLLTLIAAESGQAALAAYIRGGEFFRVLVPPGTYRLRFASGEVWHGEEALFGPGPKTRIVEMPEPLTFETRGLGIKAGHVVTLHAPRPGEVVAARSKDHLICQSFRPGFAAPRHPLSPGLHDREIRRRGPLPIWPAPGAEPWHGPEEELLRPGTARRFLPIPRLDTRSRYCW